MFPAFQDFFSIIFPEKKLKRRNRGLWGVVLGVFKVKVGQNQKDQNDGVIGSRKKWLKVCSVCGWGNFCLFSVFTVFVLFDLFTGAGGNS